MARIVTRIAPYLFRALAPILSTLIVACGLTGIAWADCVPARKVAVPKNVSSENKTRAFERYKAGNDLMKKKDYEGALALFLRSRELWQNRSNTKNAAICSFELGLYPEALALYEELQDRFAADLDGEERELVATTVADLKKRVLIADITDSMGTFSIDDIDDEACGSLPRTDPVYLMPGSHILRVVPRRGQPPSLAAFSGSAGERIRVGIPKPPPPPPPPPELGRWFIQGSLGPAIGWSGIGTLPVDQLQQSAGVLAQAYGGYRLSNGTMVALNTGLLYLESSVPLEKGIPLLKFQYTGTHEWQMYSPFVGITVGWGTQVKERFDIWFRGGLGLMSTQSKQVIADASLVPLLSIDGPPQKKVIPVDMAGRQVVRSVPGYATVEIGGAVHVGALRIGLMIGGLFLLDEGPALPDLYVIPRDRDSNACSVLADDSSTADPDDGDCVPNLRLVGERAYRPSFVLLPQLVIGF